MSKILQSMAARKPQVLILCHNLDRWNKCKPFSSSSSLQNLYLSSYENLHKSKTQRNVAPLSSSENIYPANRMYKVQMQNKMRSVYLLNGYAKNTNNHQQSKQKTQYFSIVSIVPSILKIMSSLIIMGTLYSLISDGPDFHLVTKASCSSKSKKSEDDSDKKHKKKDKKKSSSKKKEKVMKVDNLSLSYAIEQVQQLCIKKKEQVGCPGIVVCVSVDGKQIYAEGFGYADLENHTPIKPNSVLRIASISKAITATIIAKLFENNQVDLDQVIQHYVPDFPEKEFLGEKVSITVRQLLNHTSGIRHYKADDDPVYASDKNIASLVDKFKAVTITPFFTMRPSRNCSEKLTLDKIPKKEKSEMERKEYYIAKPYKTTKESLTLFANDRLFAKPGCRYIYSTYGYTLLAAVVEAVTKKPFTDTLKETLRHLGLQETYLDYNDPIIYNRARSYVKDSRGCVINAPYVDLSYKWAGGGMLSSPEDIVKFGNILLYSAQHSPNDPGLPGYLSSSTLATFWLPKETSTTKYYGLGFEVVPGKEDNGLCAELKFGAGHSGAAIGVSSALFILPRYLPEEFLGADHKEKSTDFKTHNVGQVISQSDHTFPINLPYEAPAIEHIVDQHINADESISAHLVSYIKNKHRDSVDEPASCPKGVVVAVFTNMINVSVTDVAENIARIFEKVQLSKK